MNISDLSQMPPGGPPVAEIGYAGPPRAVRHRVLREQLLQELNPLGIIEGLLVNDIARRAAQTEYLDHIADELDLQVAGAVGDVGVAESNGSQDASGLGAAVIAGSGQLDDIFRLSIGCSRAFNQAVGQLRVLIQERRDNDRVPGAADPRFGSELDCLNYLVRRFQTGEQSCPRCTNSAGGSWIAARLCWQCRACRAQTGIRVGTVAERSSLPLCAWFAAIRLVLFQPRIHSASLAEQLGIRRLPTVRRMKRTIAEAIAADNASARLAGLDRLYLPLS